MRVRLVLVGDDDSLVLGESQVGERAIRHGDDQGARRAVGRREADLQVVRRAANDVVQACVGRHLGGGGADGVGRDVPAFPPGDALRILAGIAVLEIASEVREAGLAPGISDHRSRRRRCCCTLRAVFKMASRSPWRARRSIVSAKPSMRAKGTASEVEGRFPWSWMRAQRPSGTRPARRRIAAFSSGKQRISIRSVRRVGRGSAAREPGGLLPISLQVRDVRGAPVFSPAGAPGRQGLAARGPCRCVTPRNEISAFVKNAGDSTCWRAVATLSPKRCRPCPRSGAVRPPRAEGRGPRRNGGDSPCWRAPRGAPPGDPPGPNPLRQTFRGASRGQTGAREVVRGTKRQGVLGAVWPGVRGERSDEEPRRRVARGGGEQSDGEPRRRMAPRCRERSDQEPRRHVAGVRRERSDEELRRRVAGGVRGTKQRGASSPYGPGARGTKRRGASAPCRSGVRGTKRRGASSPCCQGARVPKR
jgi:hypothetical protein